MTLLPIFGPKRGRWRHPGDANLEIFKNSDQFRISLLTVNKSTDFQDYYLFLLLFRTVWPFCLFFGPKRGRWRHPGDAKLEIFKNSDQSRIIHLEVEKFTKFQDYHLFLSLDRAVWSFCPCFWFRGLSMTSYRGKKWKFSQIDSMIGFPWWNLVKIPNFKLWAHFFY